MEKIYSKLFAIIALLILCTNFSKAFSVNTNQINKTNTAEKSQKLNLIPSDKKIEHVFRITLSKKDFRNLSDTADLAKNYISECVMTYNGDTLKVNELELRGKSTMKFKRKSFSVKLDKKLSFTKDNKKYKFKKLNLISLSMDQNYYRNKVAFDMMHQLGLFNLFFSYAEVIVNDKTQGIYLIVQKPKNYAFKKEDANVMLRRDYEHEINKTYYKGKDSTVTNRYKEAFLNIYDELLRKEGPVFYNELAEILDVEQYFSWMAFNYLIGNKDYTDEIFFFNVGIGDSIKFRIIPWDYDDIFYEQPHEGYIVRYVSYGEKLAFSSEDALDFKIIRNDYTYEKYLVTLKRVVEKLQEPNIKSIFENTYQELYPFYSKKEILKVTKDDRFGKTNLTKLESDMQKVYEWLLQRRTETIEKL